MDYSKESNNKKRKKNKATAKKAKNKVGALFLRVMIIGFVVACFAGVGAALGIYTGIIESAPEIDVSLIRPESYTTIIYDSNGVEIDRLHGVENREYAKFSEIPADLRNAFVSIEDERFYQHNGIDFRGIMRAAVKNVQSGSLSEGASTITQQLIKLNVLKDSEKKFKRKIQEQYMAINYEKALTEQFNGDKKSAKDYILEVYMNSINLGHGNNGVKAAAEYYFNKELSELTLAEAACIAGITQNPTELSPKNDPAANKERQSNVLYKMWTLEYITQKEYEDALAEDIYTRINTNFENYDVNTQFYHSYFVDHLISELAEDIKFQKNLTEAEAYNLIYSGGLRIYTTIDTNMQKIMDDAFANDEYFPPNEFQWKVIYSLSLEDASGEVEHFGREGYGKNDEQIEAFKDSVKEELVTDGLKIVNEVVQKIPQPQSGMVIMDYRTGEVKALTGGRGDKTELGQRPFNRATQAFRQPGSVFKVMAAYAPGIDTGRLTAGTVIVDEPWSLGSYSPGNHWGSTFRGPMTVRTAIEQSANVVTVRALVEYVGIDTAFDYLENFGFSKLVDGEQRGGEWKTDRGAAMALGGITDGVSMMELTAAFGAIANDGMYLKPTLYTRVMDHDGDLFLEYTPEPRQVMGRQAAYIVTDMMKGVMTRGTGGLGRFRNISMPISGKTGTTQDERDQVFAGYTPYYASAIYIGHDMPKPMSMSYSYHLVLWREIMEQIHQDLEYKDFERPEGIVSATVCTISGDLPVAGLCTTTVTDLFIPGTVPSTSCSSHEVALICTESGLLATEFCPLDLVEERVFTNRKLPPMLAGNADQSDSSSSTAPTDFCDIHTTAVDWEDDDPVVIDPETGLPEGLGNPQIGPPAGVDPNSNYNDANPASYYANPNNTNNNSNTNNNNNNNDTSGSGNVDPDPGGVQFSPPSIDDFIYVD